MLSISKISDTISNPHLAYIGTALILALHQIPVFSSFAFFWSSFTILEPMGVVGIVAPEENSLLGLISSIIPAILSGNTCVTIVSEKLPLCAISLAVVISNSDVPNGVVNIITGSKDELVPHIAQHMDVNALGINIDNKELKNKMFFQASNNLKRVVDVSKYNIED